MLANFDPHHGDVIRLIKEAGASAYPEEACGLIVADGRYQRVVRCKNTHAKPNEFFTIGAMDYIEATKIGEPLAVWHTHSHGSSQPSDVDRAACEASGLPWLIIGVSRVQDAMTFDDPYLLEPCGFKMDYVGRPYVEGVFDCYTIVRDWLWNERGIKLNEYPRRLEDGRPGYTLFLDRYADEGFVKVEGPAQPGDVFMMQVLGSVPNHLGLYLGDDVILHHTHGRLSGRAVYGGYWAKHTVLHLRHKSC